MLTWWIVGTWAATAVGGLTMAAVFLRHNGMAQSERDAIGPLRVLPHVGLAAVGFALWIAYAVSESDALGWAAMACIVAAFLIAGTFLLTRDQQRRADLARAQVPPLAGAGTSPPATPTTTSGAPAPSTQARRAIPAEHFIPIWLAGGHGLVGAATLVMVLLERAGVGGS